MARVRDGKIKYRITDNLYIYNNGKADFLVYLNAVFEDTNNLDEHRVEEMINRELDCEYILNMNDVENSVSKSIQPYIKVLRKKAHEELDIFALYIFLLKLKLHIRYIGDVLLKKELYDQYNKIREDNNFVYIMVDYLLDKRKTEQTLQKWKPILKDINVFYDLYSAVEYLEDASKDFILHNYNKFKETLANVLKAYQNVDTNTKDVLSAPLS